MQPSMAAPSHFTVDDDVRDAELGANDAAVQPPSFDPLLFADARSVLVSLLSPWDEQHTQTEDLLRPWPVIDPTLPRGALRGPTSLLNSVKTSVVTEDVLELPNKGRPSKRRRIESATGESLHAAHNIKTKGAANVGALPFPNVPGVPKEKMAAMVDSGLHRRCGVCAACTQSNLRACQALDAIATWDKNLGGVTGEMVRQIASALVASTGKGMRCGVCRSCRRQWQDRRSCETVKAITSGELPLRLQGVLKNTEFQSSLLQQQQMTAALVAEYNACDKANPMQSTPEAVLGCDASEEDALESDGDERWISWAPYLASGLNSGGPQAPARRPVKLRSRKDGKRGACQNLVIDNKLTDWICRAGLPVGEETGPDGLAFKSCGHLNSGKRRVCEACGTMRWDGPCGQLRARVTAALATGGFLALQARPLEEVAEMVAAKIAWESGTLTAPLPGMDTAIEEEGQEDHPTLVEDVFTILNSILQEQKQATHITGSLHPDGSEKEQHTEKAARMARHTVLARAVADLELAMMRLVEEQAAVRRCQGHVCPTERGNENTLEPTGSERTKVNWLTSGLGPGDRLGPHGSSLTGPFSSQNPHDGINIGFVEFRERVTAALQQTEEGSNDDAHAAGLRSLCQQLYVNPPPEGWSASSVALLESALGQQHYLQELHLAAQHGGQLSFRRALFLMLRRVAGHLGTTDRAGVPLEALSQDRIRPATEGASSQRSRKPAGTGVQSSQNVVEDTNAIPFPFPTGLDNTLKGWEERPLFCNEPLDRFFSSGRKAVINETDRGARRVSNVSMIALGFVYKLTHSILDNAALGRAHVRCPTSLPQPQRAKVLKYAQFPLFPPLPLPRDHHNSGEKRRVLPVSSQSLFCDPIYCQSDSRVPVQTMIPEVSGKRKSRGGAKREAGNGAPLLRASPEKSAFGPFDGGPGVGGGPSHRLAATDDVHEKLDSLLGQLTPEVVLVFSAALKAGVRPEVVLAAVEKACGLLQ